MSRRHIQSATQPLMAVWRGTTQFVGKSPVIPIIALLWLVFSVLVPSFATWMNMRTLLAASAVVAVAAAGETLVLLTGGIDLSLATIISCSSVIAATFMAQTGDPLFGLAVALLVGIVFGLVNGVAIGIFGLTPFVLTLGTYLVARGIAFSVSGGIAVKGTPQGVINLGTTDLFGVPVIALVAILVLIVTGVCLSKTTWGRNVYFVGSNERAAHYVGIRSGVILMSVYVVAGGLSGLAGFLSIANLGVAIPGVGDTLLLTIIGGVILGGTSLFGGEGSMGRTALGVLLLASLTNGLNLLGISFYDQLIAQGIVILGGTGLAVRLLREGRRD